MGGAIGGLGEVWHCPLVSCLSVQVLKVLNSRSTVRELSLKDLYHTLLCCSCFASLFNCWNDSLNGFPVLTKARNRKDLYVLAVMKDRLLVGHVLRTFSVFAFARFTVMSCKNLHS